MAGGDILEKSRGREISDNELARTSRQQVIGQQRQDHLLGNGGAGFVRQGNTVRIYVEQKAGVGVERRHERRKLQRYRVPGSGWFVCKSYALDFFVYENEAESVGLVQAAQNQ